MYDDAALMQTYAPYAAQSAFFEGVQVGKTELQYFGAQLKCAAALEGTGPGRICDTVKYENFAQRPGLSDSEQPFYLISQAGCCFAFLDELDSAKKTTSLPSTHPAVHTPCRNDEAFISEACAVASAAAQDPDAADPTLACPLTSPSNFPWVNVRSVRRNLRPRARSALITKADTCTGSSANFLTLFRSTSYASVATSPNFPTGECWRADGERCSARNEWDVVDGPVGVGDRMFGVGASGRLANDEIHSSIMRGLLARAYTTRGYSKEQHGNVMKRDNDHFNCFKQAFQCTLLSSSPSTFVSVFDWPRLIAGSPDCLEAAKGSKALIIAAFRMVINWRRASVGVVLPTRRVKHKVSANDLHKEN
ncbi:hypothetical protein BJ742DRAFT_740630 [Cladochytrium replicatum]|nr:hypothetical protein BJ742DRAFT_740630 [Cladochytrium replicatum]